MALVEEYRWFPLPKTKKAPVAPAVQQIVEEFAPFGQTKTIKWDVIYDKELGKGKVYTVITFLEGEAEWVYIDKWEQEDNTFKSPAYTVSKNTSKQVDATFLKKGIYKYNLSLVDNETEDIYSISEDEIVIL
jgi:hypothetical protein